MDGMGWKLQIDNAGFLLVGRKDGRVFFSSFFFFFFLIILGPGLRERVGLVYVMWGLCLGWCGRCGCCFLKDSFIHYYYIVAI